MLFSLPHVQHQRGIEEDDEKLLFISQALGLRDKYTEGHGRRVSLYAERLARRLGLSAEDIENIRIGGMLHDIGKIGFSNRIFSNEEATLTKDMHDEIHAHPWIGRVILSNLNFNESVLDCVYYHHEHVDGKGYPCGLCNDEIPLGAKIISVADCFDAMTTDRPYQGRKSLPETYATLVRISGIVLSAGLVSAFIQEIRENGVISETIATPAMAQ
jgi:putative nucleotidyltransferase with HDIG domain